MSIFCIQIQKNIAFVLNCRVSINNVAKREGFGWFPPPEAMKKAADKHKRIARELFKV